MICQIWNSLRMECPEYMTRSTIAKELDIEDVKDSIDGISQQFYI